VEGWLARNRARNDLEVVIATATLARTYEREGRWAAALRVAKPVAASQQFDAMARTAVALEHLGRGADAETLAVFGWQRYPDNNEALSLVAELFWRHGKLADAAGVLAHPRVPLTAGEWRWTLAPHFVAAFATDAAAALQGVDHLIAAGVPVPTLMELAVGCGNEGRRDLAFEILQRMPRSATGGRLPVYPSYHQLKRWKGQAAALTWIRPRVDSLGASRLATLTYEAYRNDDPELLWELGPVMPGADGEFQWLMRAAASRRWRDGDPAHERDLTEHFARRSADRYRTLGRFLRGLEPDSVALALAVAPDNACEVFYYMGLKAQSEGRYRQAAEFYARTVVTNQVQQGEYQWAKTQLHEWQNRYRTLAKLAEIDREERMGTMVAGGSTAGGDGRN
jgi:tetratricopeptide (TPR) repeat protein